MELEFRINNKENNMALETNLSGFDITEVRENEAGFNYYGFSKADGSWKILREKSGKKKESKEEIGERQI